MIARAGAARGYRIDSLPEDEADLYRLAAWSQVALPCTAGGYEHHFVNPDAKAVVGDVADRAFPAAWVPRRRLWIREGFIGTAPEPASGDVEIVDVWGAGDTDELRATCEPAARQLLGNGTGRRRRGWYTPTWRADRPSATQATNRERRTRSGISGLRKTCRAQQTPR